MLILLQRINSSLFVAADGTWTEHEHEAKRFEHFLEALAYARNYVSGPVGAYCVFQDPSYNFLVYLRNASSAIQWDGRARTIEEKVGGRTLDTGQPRAVWGQN